MVWNEDTCSVNLTFSGSACCLTGSCLEGLNKLCVFASEKEKDGVWREGCVSAGAGQRDSTKLGQAWSHNGV